MIDFLIPILFLPEQHFRLQYENSFIKPDDFILNNGFIGEKKQIHNVQTKAKEKIAAVVTVTSSFETNSKLERN